MAPMRATIDICLQFTKFSYALGTKPSGAIAWSHVTSDNLFVLVKGSEPNAGNGQLIMRIIDNNKESIDIAAHIDNANKTRYALEQAGMRPKVDQLPAFAITKDSLLALRYPGDNGQATRVQLRMHTNDDCQQIVKLLLARGISLKDPRPGTALSTTSRSTKPVEKTRPQSIDFHSSYFNPSEPALQSSLYEVTRPSSMLDKPPSTPALSSLQRKEWPSDPAERDHEVARSVTAGRSSTPVTAPLLFEAPTSQREYPRRGTGVAETRPTSALDLPPLPTPSFAKDASYCLEGPANVSSSAGRPDYRPSTRARPQRPLLPDESEIPDRAVTIRPNGSAMPAYTDAASRGEHRATKHQSQMDDLLQSRKPHAERSSNDKVFRTNSMTDAPHEILSPPAMETSNKPPKLSNALFANSASSGGNLDQNALEQFASRRLNDRQAALEDFMIANLENPAFTTLCEDVENCWRRIAFGL